MVEPGGRRPLISASILDADLADLGRSVERATAAGVDRIHLDIMDGHFVPNLTFGARTGAALRSHTGLPFDAHLMIANPERSVDEFVEAGCATITLHVEVERRQVESSLRRIRDAGRLAGLALKPATDLAALEPYRPLLDVVMVMTVEPGFGGQAFMADVGAAKLGPAHELLADPDAGEVHVDGGVRHANAELVGRHGADVVVVGSALFRAPDMAAEVRAIRAALERGRAAYRPGGRATGRAPGLPPVPPAR